ncbi:hypothetical protein [Bythopirellula polymerisocia]|uniref:Uncharacterized protein n=1 Tax=Bythopirellula polymerisocia TaxID=2528003 RepID=A0A5C6CCV4_9BACT|nr:hypothetical protein [Bythopirellula polymerisocia]TWU21284.1 hypothetical protein Pla144_46930 [Bythopirellula polymerisocia]
MSEENKEKSTWDELVGELGVNVTDDALERRQPAPKELPTRRREKGDKVEESQANPSDWESLASSLGIEVPPLAEQPPVEKPVAPPKVAPPKPDTSRSEKTASPEPRAESKRSVKESTVEIEAESERVDSSEFVEQTDEEEGDKSELPRISGEAARSAFDALFAADAASWGSAFVSPRTNVESSFLFTEGEEAVFTEDIPDGAVEEGDEEEEPKRGRRRRRRGGRGRGRSGAKAADEGESDETKESENLDESIGEESTDPESEEAPEKRRRRRRSRGRSRKKDDQDLSSEEEDSQIKKHVASHVSDDDEEDDDEDDEVSYDDDENSSARGGRSSHRNLPTWDEAIGGIVDSNLAQRSKSPANSGSSSSRGRSRGGRRHKKS